MTEQNAFDWAVAGLRSQKFRRSRSGGQCLYNDPDGNRHCAIGWLILGLPVRHNSCPFQDLLSGSPAVAERLSGLPPAFLEALQSAHDGGAILGEDAPQRMIDALRAMAERRGLDQSVLVGAEAEIA